MKVLVLGAGRMGYGAVFDLIKNSPDVETVTVADMDASKAKAVANAVGDMKREQIADRSVFKENLRIHLKRFVQKELSGRPVIVTTVVEV